jgi:anaerobic magnesium-protoporphyrin IX monomethyl ester cyclase
VFNFADENPATDKEAWKSFLVALIAENIPIILVGSTRADNIVRDADILHLYKKAGFERFLLGIENCDETILENIKKNGNVRADREAIKLLRKHGILSMVTYVFGFGNETTIDFVKNYRKLRSYDPDQIQLMYVTPHRWTPYFNEIKSCKIIQPDQRKWDYKHQVLATDHLSPFQIILYVKLLELAMQIRLKSLKRLFFHPDKSLRKAMKWYYKIGRKVWFYELFCFFFMDKTRNKGLSLEGFWK